MAMKSDYACEDHNATQCAATRPRGPAPSSDHTRRSTPLSPLVRDSAQRARLRRDGAHRRGPVERRLPSVALAGAPSGTRPASASATRDRSSTCAPRRAAHARPSATTRRSSAAPGRSDCPATSRAATRDDRRSIVSSLWWHRAP
eukprot:764429-Prymnesium_polylepis.1